MSKSIRVKSLEEARQLWPEIPVGLQNVVNQKFNRLTALYQTSKSPNSWVFLCDCGNYLKATLDNVKRQKTKSCGCYMKECCAKVGHSNRYDMIGKTFGKLTVLSFSHANERGRLYWNCRCECGKEYKVAGCFLRDGSIQSCGCVKSAGEAKIRQILLENNINFIQEYTNDTCCYPESGFKAKFDFYITEGNYIIEFDGIQHFKYNNTGWDTKEKYEYTKYHDEFKNEWCRKNNIPIIRIPYTHLKNITLEDLTLNSKFLLKEDNKNES